MVFSPNKYTPCNHNKVTNIIQWNVRSLPARLPTLQHLLFEYKCSVALLSETWLLPTRSLTIPGFKTYHFDRPDGYGGVAIVIHNSLKSKLIPIDIPTRNRYITHNIDILGVEILSAYSSSPLKVWSCYIPSSSNVPTNLWLDIFNLASPNTLIGGDFNALHPAWGSSSVSRRGTQIYDTIDSLGLCVLNDGNPTHIGRPNSTDSAIDLTFCSPDLMWYLSWRTLGGPHGSDHIPIILTVNLYNITHPASSKLIPDNAPINVSPFNFYKADWSSFSLQIQNAISTLTDSLLPFNYSTLTSIINQSAESTIPRKKSKTNFYPPSPPWWNPSCTEAVKNRSLLFKNFRRSGSMSDFLIYRNACANTTRILKQAKKNSWKNFCSNLKPTYPIQHLWATAKRYKNCINPVSRPKNDDWFDTFCSKVAACYVPSESESCTTFFSQISLLHVLTNNFTMSELNLAISSRKSTASGLDNISPLMLKHLPSNALDSLLVILNILITQQIPPSWITYRVIPIPKPNSNTSFRPIALSSSIFKVFKYMLKCRLDWWLESNSFLSENLFAFRKGVGTMECLSTLIGNIYHSFNNREFLVSTFVDIRSAFDSVNIPTCISSLLSLNVPSKFCNILFSLFKFRKLTFSSPFGSSTTRSTFTGLPQGICLSPILFNVYMSIVYKHLSSLGHKCLIYADDLVIFSSNKSLNISIDNINSALKDLKFILTKLSFEVAPEKCKSVIFTRRRYINHLNIYFDNNIIPFVPTITYLGIILDPKLRWSPHITSLTTFTSRWSNFLRSITGTWWGSHPSCLLSIYFSIIRSKLDYGCFLFGSASFCNWKNLTNFKSPASEPLWVM